MKPTLKSKCNEIKIKPLPLKEHTLQVRLTAQTASAALIRSNKQGLRVSEYIRHLIEKDLESEKKNFNRS